MFFLIHSYPYQKYFTGSFVNYSWSQTLILCAFAKYFTIVVNFSQVGCELFLPFREPVFKQLSKEYYICFFGRIQFLQEDSLLLANRSLSNLLKSIAIVFQILQDGIHFELPSLMPAFILLPCSLIRCHIGGIKNFNIDICIF